MKRYGLLFLINLVLNSIIMAQNHNANDAITHNIKAFFERQEKLNGIHSHVDSCVVDTEKETLKIFVDNRFAVQQFTKKSIISLYKELKNIIEEPYCNYDISINTCSIAIEELVGGIKQENYTWGNISHNDAPWTQNVSFPIKIRSGLQLRHISLCASHGMYYDNDRKKWQWQRPPLFGTREDLYTQTIVVPYLIPMLEKAGAVVFTPRERDWQKQEVIVDNDNSTSNASSYIEKSTKHSWYTSNKKGFALHGGTYSDNENPFTAGTARIITTTDNKNKYSSAYYVPYIPKEGKYAVYVSYQTFENSIEDVEYTVWHKGIATEFRVNQRMGGGTWVYLGTFDFNEGGNENNCVVITNRSQQDGVVTTDAVRFGGGIGNIEREGKISNMPRCLEGARYWAQWAGMPYEVYSLYEGQNDYKDDINVRSLMTNFLAGGSCYIPDSCGLGVPIELSLAIHSDAGYANDDEEVIGSLAICTTNHNDGILASGLSRQTSRDFAEMLSANIARDITLTYGKWNRRTLYDRNYSETRIPEIPSAIIETLSHQNFNDMRFGQDPNFKFTLARSIYKTILRYICGLHKCNYVVTPLTPNNFQVILDKEGTAHITWNAVEDPLEPTATPDGYILYIRSAGGDFDNGTYIKGSNGCTVKLKSNVLYSFKVTAINDGGESFPTETLCAFYTPEAKTDIIIVNGFHRLSSPYIVNNTLQQGFDLNNDLGITYGSTPGWAGRQIVFDRSRVGIVNKSGLGWGNDEMAGLILAGNTMDYTCTHAQAITHSGNYNISSTSSMAVENNLVTLSNYKIVDIILGLECNDKRSLKPYKTFNHNMQNALRQYVSGGGSLLISGSYVASDMQEASEKAFIADVLKCSYGGVNYNCGDVVNGMSTTLQFYNTLNEYHYAATSPDILLPLPSSYAVLGYDNGRYAAVAYDGKDYRCFTMGFPFECIVNENKREYIMRGLLNFFLK